MRSPAEKDHTDRATAKHRAASAAVEVEAKPSRQRPMNPRVAQRLQAAVGNRAVSAMMAQRRGESKPAGTVVDAPETPAAAVEPEVPVQRLATGSRAGAGSDPKFAALKSEVRGKQKTVTAHRPPATLAAGAQAAARPPADDKLAQGKAANAEKMNAAQPGTFDKAAFIAAVNQAINAQAPKNLDEADNFGDSGKADAVKGQVQGQVGQGKEASAKAIETTTKAAPDTAAAKEKPVTPLSPEQTPGNPGAPNAANAVPDKAPPAATDFSRGPAQVDQMMAGNQVTDKTLGMDPEFAAAKGAKKEGEQHAAAAPGQVRTAEANTLAQAKAGAAQSGAAVVNTMAVGRQQADTANRQGQNSTQTGDEAKRAQVTAKLQTVFDATKTDVENILSGLDKKVDDAFGSGEKAARDAFTADHKRRMDAYKDARYSGLLGKGRWIKDKFAGLPEEANQIFVTARAGYVSRMQQVISNVADVIGAELNRAKQRIATGRNQLRAEVAKLPADLQSIGKQAAGEFAGKFDELAESVDAKGQELVQTLASKYNEALKAVDAEIEAEKEKNEGLIAKAVDAVKGVIDTIIKLKDLLLGVLAKAASAVMAILKDPIGFLGNLVSAVGAGLRNFMANIGEHLKKGLIGWLLGAMSGAGLQLPAKFDLRGILSMIASLLGLTWAAIRGRIVAKGVPEQAMGAVEAGVPLVAKLQSEGVEGVTEEIKEQVGDLKGNLLGKISEYLIPTVLIAGITWIVSLLNPASAFIKACKMIIDIVTFIIERGAQIIEFVNAVLDAVIAIATGGTGGVPNLIEKALAKSIPVLIGALAAILGIGGIADKVKKFFQALSKPVMKAVDWVVGKIVKLGKAIWARMKAVGGKIRDKAKERFGTRKGHGGAHDPDKGVPVDPNTPMTPAELARHRELAQAAVRELQQPEPPGPYAQIRHKKEAKARVVETNAQPQLRQGIKLTVLFTEPPSGAVEPKIRFHVRIAPNDTDADGAVPLTSGGPATPMAEVPHNFYHGTDKPTAASLSGRRTIEGRGRGEFGGGFYTFAQQEPAELAAEQYTRNRRDGATAWGVVEFGVPVAVLQKSGLLEAVTQLSPGPYVLVFPDRNTAVDVRYPDEIAPNVTRSLTWKEFRDENRRLGGEVNWGYDLIIGPLSGTLPGFKNVNQFLFNEQGLYALNDSTVSRRLVAEGAL